VLVFGAAPSKPRVLAGSTPAGTCDRSKRARDVEHRGISVRLYGRIHADLDLHCLGRLADWLRVPIAIRTRSPPSVALERHYARDRYYAADNIFPLDRLLRIKDHARFGYLRAY
jgi:hypothetical protein